MNKYLKNWCDKQIARAGVYPGANVTINDERIYWRVVREGSLAVGEGYVEQWWDTDSIDDIMTGVFRSSLQKHKLNQGSLPILASKVARFFLNQQTKRLSREVAEQHYDVGNDLYSRMLGKHMAYTCAYWKNAETLDQAQEDKYDLVCRKLKLEPGMRVLDLGCGFGGLSKFMAEHYDVSVVAVNISKEQVEFARNACNGLSVEIRQQDYRDVTGTFDRIASVGLMEHVGAKNYRSFFRLCSNLLTADGLMLLHTIGRKDTSDILEPWFNRYIFPGGCIPSFQRLAEGFDDIFVLEDTHNIGDDYDKTLMCWYQNFVDSWDEIRDDYPADFFRIWEYYLLSCAGAFRARHYQLWQLVLSPQGVTGGYESIR